MAEKREKRKPEQLQKTCSGRQKKSNYLQEGHGISGIFGEMK